MKKGADNHRSNQMRKNCLILSNDGMARGLFSFAYFRKRLNELKLSNRVSVTLAGLIASKGVRPDVLAVKTLKKCGLSVNGFKVQQVDEALLKRMDFVIALSRENYNYLKNTYHTIPSRIRILGVSPILPSSKEADYEKAFAEIRQGLERELESLEQKN